MKMNELFRKTKDLFPDFPQKFQQANGSVSLFTIMVTTLKQLNGSQKNLLQPISTHLKSATPAVSKPYQHISLNPGNNWVTITSKSLFL